MSEDDADKLHDIAEKFRELARPLIEPRHDDPTPHPYEVAIRIILYAAQIDKVIGRLKEGLS